MPPRSRRAAVPGPLAPPSHHSERVRLQVITASTRPSRKEPAVSAGTRSVNTLTLTAVTLRMMPIPEVTIPFFSRHLDEETGAVSPGEVQEKAATAMLDELLRWAEALRPLREAQPATKTEAS